MMRYHLMHFADRDEQIPQARALLKSFAECKDEPDVYHMLPTREFERFLAYPDAGSFHDDLSPINRPVYFGEFIDHTIRYGL